MRLCSQSPQPEQPPAPAASRLKSTAVLVPDKKPPTASSGLITAIADRDAQSPRKSAAFNGVQERAVNDGVSIETHMQQKFKQSAHHDDEDHQPMRAMHDMHHRLGEICKIQDTPLQGSPLLVCRKLAMTSTQLSASYQYSCCIKSNWFSRQKSTVAINFIVRCGTQQSRPGAQGPQKLLFCWHMSDLGCLNWPCHLAILKAMCWGNLTGFTMTA